MPCSDPSHHHEWPEEGELVIYRCERYCAFCTGDDANHEWKYPWFLRRHVRAVHGREYPDFWVSDRWNANYDDGNSTPSTPKKKTTRLKLDGRAGLKSEFKNTPCKKKAPRTPRSLKSIKSPGTPTRRRGGARSKARFLGRSPTASPYSESETHSEEDDLQSMNTEDEGAFLSSPAAERQSSLSPREPEHFADSFHHHPSTIRAPTTPPPELGGYADDKSEYYAHGISIVARRPELAEEESPNALRYNVDPPLSAGLAPESGFGSNDRSCNDSDSYYGQSDPGASCTARDLEIAERYSTHLKMMWRGDLLIAINQAFSKGLKPGEMADVLLEEAYTLDRMQQHQDGNQESMSNGDAQPVEDQISQLIEVPTASDMLRPVESVDNRTISSRRPYEFQPELIRRTPMWPSRGSDNQYASHIAEFFATPVPGSDLHGSRFGDMFLDSLIQHSLRARGSFHPSRGESSGDFHGVAGDGLTDTIDPRLNDPSFFVARTHNS